MVFRQSSDDNTEQRVEEGVETSCREGADAGPCGLIRLRSSDGPLTGHQEINKNSRGMLRSCKLRRKRKKNNEPDGLSDIDDAEVSGYLNTKEEILYKRLLWEAVYGNCTKAKKQKRTTEEKKVVPVKKAGKTTKNVESQRPSSRISYDALGNLNDELEIGSAPAQIISSENLPYGNINHGSNEGSYNDGELYYEDGDEQVDDEYFDF